MLVDKITLAAQWHDEREDMSSGLFEVPARRRMRRSPPSGSRGADAAPLSPRGRRSQPEDRDHRAACRPAR